MILHDSPLRKEFKVPQSANHWDSFIKRKQHCLYMHILMLKHVGKTRWRGPPDGLLERKRSQG